MTKHIKYIYTFFFHAAVFLSPLSFQFMLITKLYTVVAYLFPEKQASSEGVIINKHFNDEREIVMDYTETNR